MMHLAISPKTPVLFACLFLSACAQISSQRLTSSVYTAEQSTCLEQFARSDTKIRQAGALDAQNYRIPTFEFLRTNRFLSSFAAEVETAAERETWIRHLAALDENDRKLEYQKLTNPMHAPTITALRQCREQLIDATLASELQFNELVERAAVPDAYSTAMRTLGVYPVSSQFVLAGVRRLQHTHDVSIDGHEAPGAQRYAHLDTSEQVARGVPSISKDTLGIPLLDPSTAAALTAKFRPTWSVEQRSPSDAIGALQYNGAALTVDTENPTEYTSFSYARFHGEIILQINYTVWFPSRPRTGVFDILGGDIDGLTWRVNIDAQGRVLAMDVMHNCGCYYMVFPNPQLRTIKSEGHEEPVWIPGRLPSASVSRATIGLASGSHYVRSVSFHSNDQDVTSLQLADYDVLRNLNSVNGPRSAFGSDGLIHQSRRPERWLLWPMGVRSAGAMRQTGHHAIAFVGRRHFDDPDLLARYFDRDPGVR